MHKHDYWLITNLLKSGLTSILANDKTAYRSLPLRGNAALDALRHEAQTYNNYKLFKFRRLNYH